jgi:hypothetical protein
MARTDADVGDKAAQNDDTRGRSRGKDNRVAQTSHGARVVINLEPVIESKVLDLVEAENLEERAGKDLRQRDQDGQSEID